jgi:hypothetical protein
MPCRRLEHSRILERVDLLPDAIVETPYAAIAGTLPLGRSVAAEPQTDAESERFVWLE